MKLEKRKLCIVLIFVLVLSACTQPPTPTSTQTEVSPTKTVAPPTPTITSSPTPGAERLISFNKPVRVSAYWIVDPPERAVDGDLGNWWGAGGTAPQWIEVDLQGVYSISKVRVINQGPTGQATYQVLGRGPGEKNKLLHVFDGVKKENQKLEFSPETPWEGISAIRVEILNGGPDWVGLREVQVFSRKDPEPLPVSVEPQVPSFLAQVDLDKLEKITPDNAILMEQLAMLGRGKINQLVWSPDGKILAVASTLGVWLYDLVALDSLPRLLEGHTRDVLGVAFSPDGVLVLSASQDGTVKQWNVATGELERTVPLWDDFSNEVGNQERDPDVWSMAFSPDADLLAAGSVDGTLRLWNLSTGKQPVLLQGHTSRIEYLAFNADGTLLLSIGGLGQGSFVWDVQTGSQRADLSGKGGSVFGPESKLLTYLFGDNVVYLMDTITGEILYKMGSDAELLYSAFSPDARTLAFSDVNGTLKLMDLKSGSTRTFKERAGWILLMAFSPDGDTLITYDNKNELSLWDIATTSHRADLASGHTNPIDSIAFSPDTSLLATGGNSGLLRLWEVETNRLHANLRGYAGNVTGVAFSPDGKLLVSAGSPGNVILWDVASGSQITVLSRQIGYAYCVAFSPDGKLVAAGFDETVRLWDVATGEERAVFSGHAGSVVSVAFSPDGSWLVSANANATLQIWEVASGRESGILRGHQDYVFSTAFDPDGSGLASGGGDFWLRVWDLKIVSGVVTGRDRFAPIGHGGRVLSVTFSPDGEIVASAGIATTNDWWAPGDITLYSAETGFPYTLLRGHMKRVTSISFSPNGKLLASGSADGSVRLWGIPRQVSQDSSGQAAQTATSTFTPTPVD